MDVRSILDVIERLFRVWVGTAWGKGALFLIAGGVVSITSMAQYVIPPIAKAFGVVITIPDTPFWLSLALILMGIGVLVLQRIVPEQIEQKPDPNPHDVELLRSYRALMTPDLIAFLTDHIFRLPFRRDILNPLERLADNWRGAHFEFLDEELQRALSAVTGAARGLCNKLDNHIFNDRNNPAIGTPLTDVDLRYGIQDETRDAIRHMNELAKGVVTTANSFERLARLKIPGG
ncbi:hypothetical protein [Bradyrhizobium sp. 162]|uniref:hypothetical protein n=1 Tax=Bradyrhizobium sp. 162 TaxID=2782635 RepID=UPI001FF9BD27|nr:hypothetical protein [Bradyrhizobium sp. 162]MCK1632649.1 hypothetical protein [Bradyrhizobium sp. 162]